MTVNPKKPRGRPKGSKDKSPRKSGHYSVLLPVATDLPSRTPGTALPPLCIDVDGRIEITEAHHRFVFDLSYLGYGPTSICEFFGVAYQTIDKYFGHTMKEARAYRAQQVSQAIQELIAMRHPATVNRHYDELTRDQNDPPLPPKLIVVDVMPDGK